LDFLTALLYGRHKRGRLRHRGAENFHRTFWSLTLMLARVSQRVPKNVNKVRSVFEVFFSELRHTLGSVRQQIVLIRKDSASVHAGAA